MFVIVNGVEAEISALLPSLEVSIQINERYRMFDADSRQRLTIVAIAKDGATPGGVYAMPMDTKWIDDQSLSEAAMTLPEDYIVSIEPQIDPSNPDVKRYREFVNYNGTPSDGDEESDPSLSAQPYGGGVFIAAIRDS